MTKLSALETLTLLVAGVGISYLVRVLLRRRTTLAEEPDRESADSGRGLDFYGDCISRYQGRGVLTVASGNPLECHFEVGQLEDGSVILLCLSSEMADLPLFLMPQDAVSFEGKSKEGQNIRSVGPMTSINWLPDQPRVHGNTMRLAYELQELHTVFREMPVAEWRYGLTNLRFMAAELHSEKTQVLKIAWSRGNTKMEVRVAPLENYQSRIRALQVIKHICVTGEVVVSAKRRYGFTR